MDKGIDIDADKCSLKCCASLSAVLPQQPHMLVAAQETGQHSAALYVLSLRRL